MKPISSIYLDPGHVGNSFFDLRHFTLDGIEFHEGDFSYLWAETLKNLLDYKMRIEISRPKGQPSLLMDSSDLNKRLRELTKDSSVEDALTKFRVPKKFSPLKSDLEFLEAVIQNEADLMNRANTASDKHFDLCLSLHLNGDPNSLRTQNNGICAFTNHLSAPYYQLFEEIIQSISFMTNLPIFRMENLEEVKSGVFIDESLRLLKNIKIPILLIEGPFQNNPDELILLNQSLLKLRNEGKVEGRLEELSLAIANIFA